jgi:indolepyruvate ferredoxin oxidoreductase
MSTPQISLSDRFDLDKSPVLLNGTQALVRLMLMQAARDRARGLDTGGYVTGYRGSPLAGVDMQMSRAEKTLMTASSGCGTARGRAWTAPAT